jgi:hypothetical protein
MAQADGVMNAWAGVALLANETVHGGIRMSPALRENLMSRSAALKDRLLLQHQMKMELMEEAAALDREEELLEARVKAAECFGLLALAEQSGNISE